MVEIRNERALLRFLEAGTRDQAKRMVYKYTDCGAWLEFLPRRAGIRVGSIVEGCDFGTATYSLLYPFTPEDYDERIKAVEAEADALWKWANEDDCEGDAPDVDYDYRHLQPDGRSS